MKALLMFAVFIFSLQLHAQAFGGRITTVGQIQSDGTIPLSLKNNTFGKFEILVRIPNGTDRVQFLDMVSDSEDTEVSFVKTPEADLWFTNYSAQIAEVYEGRVLQVTNGKRLVFSSLALVSRAPAESDVVIRIDAPEGFHKAWTPKQLWTFRMGLLGGFGAEYTKDLNEKWQLGINGATWILFTEVGTDIRYFFKRSPTTGFYFGTGLRLLNSPMLFQFGIGSNFEAGFEKVTTRGFYFAAGIGGTAIYIPPGVPSEGNGFGGVAPAFSIRVGRIKKR